MDKEIKGQSIFKSFLIDMIAGSVGGAALTISGHPFDTLKVRVQANRQMNSMWSCIKDCFMNEGITGFYKGMGFPLASVSFINAIVFATNEVTKITLGFKDDQVSLIEGTVSGSVAGLVCCIIVTPVELVKSRLQIQKESKKIAKYKGITDCLRQTYASGGIKAVYKGNIATILREIPGYGTQFGSYYYSRNIISKICNKDNKDLGYVGISLAGSISGIICWTCSFPQDVIKTNIQLDVQERFKRNKYLPDGGVIECMRYIWNKEGFKGFWAGYSPQTIQAIIGNGFMFLFYEIAKKQFSDE